MLSVEDTGEGGSTHTSVTWSEWHDTLDGDQRGKGRERRRRMKRRQGAKKEEEKEKKGAEDKKVTEEARKGGGVWV